MLSISLLILLTTTSVSIGCSDFYLTSFAAAMLDHAPLEAVYIFFDTATYDDIERDVKVILFSQTLFFVMI